MLPRPAPGSPLRRSVQLAMMFLAPMALPAIGRAQPAAFSDVTPPIMMNTTLGEGVAWGDYDGDGLHDLVVAHEGEFLDLYHNEGGGQFTRSSAPLFNTPGNYTGVAWGDFDNDGRLDLFAAEAWRPKHLLRNLGAGNFIDVATGVLCDTSHTHGVAWADIDNDGDIDLFWAAAEFPTDHLARNDGGGVFVDVTPTAMVDPNYGRGCSWADFDNDGDQDLCVANFGKSRLFRNDGDGAFQDVTPPSLAFVGQAGGISWADYDNDGDFDLFVGMGFGSVSRLLRNDGGGVFTNVTTPVIARPLNCLGGQWGDFDNDGDLDLYVGVQYGPNFLVRNEGGGVFTDATNTVLGDTSSTLGSGWCDYDNDGDLDLFWANRGQKDKLARNDLANDSHWLELDLVGTHSNRSAIGARVEVMTGAVRQMRRVDGGGAYNSQNTLRLHYGLGAAAAADSVTIHWPSGIVQDTIGVAANQILTIVERPRLLGVDGGRGPVVLRLVSPAPNPFARSVSIHYELASRAVVQLSVLDVQGRTVRVLEPRASVGAGRRDTSWDGRDDAGHALPPGIYFARLEAGDETLQRRIARLE